jgi:hypothetical protein
MIDFWSFALDGPAYFFGDPGKKELLATLALNLVKTYAASRALGLIPAKTNGHWREKISSNCKPVAQNMHVTQFYFIFGGKDSDELFAFRRDNRSTGGQKERKKNWSDGDSRALRCEMQCMPQDIWQSSH